MGDAMALVAGAIGGVLLASLVWANIFESYIPKSDAITRGYALYCPDNGRFAWVGECGQ